MMIDCVGAAIHQTDHPLGDLGCVPLPRYIASLNPINRMELVPSGMPDAARDACTRFGRLARADCCDHAHWSHLTASCLTTMEIGGFPHRWTPFHRPCQACLLAHIVVRC